MNDYQYEHMEAEFSRVIEDAEDRIILAARFGTQVWQ